MVKESPEELRERCLNAAIDLWSEESRDFTMSDLATRLRISKKTLYVHFDSKDAMLLAAIDRWFDDVKAAEQAIIADPDLSTLEKFRQVVIVQPATHGPIASAPLARHLEARPEARRRVLDHLESGWEPVLDLLREGIDAGEIRPVDVDIVRTVIESTFERLVTDPSAMGDWTRSLDAMMDLLVGGLAPRNDE